MLELIFFKTGAGFEPEELYLNEGTENCSGIDDVCIGRLAILKFYLTTSGENFSNQF
jgi:hypothetical protein